jgi:hypothetical protein
MGAREDARGAPQVGARHRLGQYADDGQRGAVHQHDVAGLLDPDAGRLGVGVDGARADGDALGQPGQLGALGRDRPGGGPRVQDRRERQSRDDLVSPLLDPGTYGTDGDG